MNLCIIAPRYPYKENMGYVFVKKLVDEWVKMGHHCVVITDFSLSSYYRKHIDYRPKEYKDQISNGQIVDVYNPRFISTNIKINDFSLDGFLAARAIERQLKKIRIKIDCFYCHFFSSSYKVFHYAEKNNIPIFVATGESNLKNLGAFDKPHPNFNFEKYRANTNGVIAVSTKNQDDAVNNGLVEKDKCIVLPNGTDLERFHPSDKNLCRKKLGLPQDDFIISCVGYICERKGQNRVLEAIRLLNNKRIKVIFLGAEAKVESFKLEGEEILFKGAVDNKDLPFFLSSSDVFCLPTLHEGCCNAIIEAMACGLPIISSDLPFNYDVLDNKNSILIDPNDIDAIAAAIQRLYDEPEIREQFSTVSLNRSRELSIEQRAKNIMSFIESRI